MRHIYQVDAFTSEPFKGNPAGVCILENEQSTEWMQGVAAEMNVSETAFLFPGPAGYEIRFFSPATEIELCGHATLSSSHILFSEGIVARSEKIMLNSKAGALTVSSDGDWIKMNFPAYNLIKAEVPEEFRAIIGKDPVEFLRTAHGWSFALMDTEEEVRHLTPDFRRMRDTTFGDLIVTAQSANKDFDFCVRCFAPALGIDEDPVTGSAHCALVPFWHNKTGKTEFLSHQVSKRGGILKVALNDNRVDISGQAVTVMKAELYV